MRHAPVLLSLVAVTLIAGCQSSFERYYVPANAGPGYPPLDTKQVQVIETGQQSADGVRQRLHPDATIIGTASFIGSHQSRQALRKFAAGIGSDLVIWSAGLIDTLVYTAYDTVEHTDTTTIVRGKGDDKKVTRITTTSTDIVPRTVKEDRYEHEVIYLRR